MPASRSSAMAPRSRVYRIGRDVDHPLKILAIDFHRSGIQLERGDVLEQDRFAGSWW